MGVLSTSVVSRTGSMRVVMAQTTSCQSADVDVVVGDDDELGVHELPQEAPQAEHQPLGCGPDRPSSSRSRHAVAAAFGRQVEVHDLRETASAGWARRLH
jgi:hypothetical protein